MGPFPFDFEEELALLFFFLLSFILSSCTLKALVWFWLIDETLSANLVYQSDYEIDSTTPSDEAMAKIMMMVMIKCLNLEKKEKNKRLKVKV